MRPCRLPHTFTRTLFVLALLLSWIPQSAIASAPTVQIATAPYVDEVHGFMLDLPVTWMVDTSVPGVTFLTSYDPSTVEGGSNFREGQTKLEIMPHEAAPGPSVDSMVADYESNAQISIRSKRFLSLADSGPAVILRIDTPQNGTYLALLAVIGGWEILINAWGDIDPEAPILAIFQSLRPTGVASKSPPSVNEAEPCGGRIAYVQWGSPYDPELWTMNVNGTDRRQLTRFPEGQAVYHPQWFPDGSRIIFTTHATTYVVNADGSSLRALPIDLETPVVSPNGQLVAGMVQVSKKTANGSSAVATSNIVVGRVGSRDTINLTGCPDTTPCNAWSPTWSPDGRHIAFAGGLPATAPMAIYLSDSDAPGSAIPVPGTEKMLGPAWSPDGTWLAAYRIADEIGFPPELVLVRPDGSNLTPLHVQVDGSNPPSWSPDSQWLVVSYNQTIKIVDLTGKMITELGRGTDPSWQPCAARSQPLLPSAELITRKQAAVSFLEHPPFDVLGLATVPLRGYDESGARALIKRLENDQGRYERGELSAAEAQAHQRSVEAFSRLTLTEEALVQLYPLVRNSNDDLVDKNIDIVFAAASFASLVQSGLQKAAAAVVGERIAEALAKKTASVLTDLVNSLWEVVELGISDPDYRLVSRNVRETLYKALLAKLTLSGADVGRVKIFEAFLGDPIKVGVLALYMQHFVDRGQPLITRGVDRVDKSADEIFFTGNVQRTSGEASSAVESIVATARSETEQAQRNYQNYKEHSGIAGIVAKSVELEQLANGGGADAGFFRLLVSGLDDLFKMSRSFYEMVAGDDLSEHCDRLLLLTADAELHSWAPSAPRVTTGPAAGATSRSITAGLFPVSYSPATAVEARLSARLARLLDTSADLDALLAQASEVIASGDRDRAAQLLDSLLTADDQYATELRAARAAALPADPAAATSDEQARFAALAESQSTLSLTSLRLYWQIVASLNDNLVTRGVADTAAAARTALTETRELAAASLQDAASADAPRRLAFASVVLPAVVEPGAAFAVDVVIRNPGAAALESVELRVQGTNVTVTQPAVALGTLVGGIERTVPLALLAGSDARGLLVLELWSAGNLNATYTAELPLVDTTAQPVAPTQSSPTLAPTTSSPNTTGATLAPTATPARGRRALPCLGAALPLLALGFALRRRTL